MSDNFTDDDATAWIRIYFEKNSHKPHAPVAAAIKTWGGLNTPLLASSAIEYLDDTEGLCGGTHALIVNELERFGIS